MLAFSSLLLVFLGVSDGASSLSYLRNVFAFKIIPRGEEYGTKKRKVRGGERKEQNSNITFICICA